MSTKNFRNIPAEALFDQWGTHIARVADDVLYLLENRRKFNKVKRMFGKHPDLNFNQDAFVWIMRLWGTEAMMGVRRELDDQNGVWNLRQLLHQMEQRADVFTRERYIEVACMWCCDPEGRKKANSTFDGYGVVRGASKTGDLDHLDPTTVRADRKHLETETAETFRYAQQLVAHRTDKDHLEIYEPVINRAIDAIKALTKKYYLLLNPNEKCLKGNPIPLSWVDPFTKPWHHSREQAPNSLATGHTAASRRTSGLPTRTI